MKILVVGIYSGIWPHFLLENQIIKGLLDSKSENYEIFYLSCNSSLQNLCLSRQYFGLNTDSSLADLEKVCKTCEKNIDLGLKNTRTKIISISENLGDGDYKNVRQIVDQISNNDIHNFIFKDYDLGRLAMYDSIIKYKKKSINFSLDEINFIRDTIFNSAITVVAGERILDDLLPDIILCTDPEYAVTSAFCSAASKKGVKVYKISTTPAVSERKSTIRIWDWQKYGLIGPALDFWGKQPSSEEFEESRVEVLIRSMKSGKSAWTYSTQYEGKSAKKEFGIPNDRKIILAVLNSTDEYLAAVVSGHYPSKKMNQAVFKNQIEWITYLISIVGELSKVTLIIRPHPRDFPNKRENLASEQSRVWSALERELPDFAILDHPERKFSLADYWPEIDVMTTAWSSTALESVLGGVPAVAYDQELLLYPKDLIMAGSSKQQYIENLVSALNYQVSADDKNRIREWLWFSNFKGSIKLHGGLFETDLLKRFKSIRIFILVLNRFFPTFIKKLELLRNIDQIEFKGFSDFLQSGKNSRYEL